jgi:hypothetical protein
MGYLLVALRSLAPLLGPTAGPNNVARVGYMITIFSLPHCILCEDVTAYGAILGDHIYGKTASSPDDEALILQGANGELAPNGAVELAAGQEVKKLGEFVYIPGQDGAQAPIIFATQGDSAAHHPIVEQTHPGLSASSRELPRLAAAPSSGTELATVGSTSALEQVSKALEPLLSKKDTSAAGHALPAPAEIVATADGQIPADGVKDSLPASLQIKHLRGHVHSTDGAAFLVSQGAPGVPATQADLAEQQPEESFLQEALASLGMGASTDYNRDTGLQSAMSSSTGVVPAAAGTSPSQDTQEEQLELFPAPGRMGGSPRRMEALSSGFDNVVSNVATSAENLLEHIPEKDGALQHYKKASNAFYGSIPQGAVQLDSAQVLFGWICAMVGLAFGAVCMVLMRLVTDRAEKAEKGSTSGTPGEQRASSSSSGAPAVSVSPSAADEAIVAKKLAALEDSETVSTGSVAESGNAAKPSSAPEAMIAHFLRATFSFVLRPFGRGASGSKNVVRPEALLSRANVRELQSVCGKTVKRENSFNNSGASSTPVLQSLSGGNTPIRAPTPASMSPRSDDKLQVPRKQRRSGQRRSSDVSDSHCVSDKDSASVYSAKSTASSATLMRFNPLAKPRTLCQEYYEQVPRCIGFLYASPLVILEQRKVVDHMLNIEDEWKSLESAVDGENVKVKACCGTFTSLQQACVKRGCRVLHIAAHGVKCAKANGSEETRLMLEDGKGGGVLLDDDSITKLLGLGNAPQLVFLNACRSSNFAQAFLKAGAQHVVCASGDVGDTSTRVFVESFYEGLAHGRSVLQAFGDAKAAFEVEMCSVLAASGINTVAGKSACKPFTNFMLKSARGAIDTVLFPPLNIPKLVEIGVDACVVPGGTGSTLNGGSTSSDKIDVIDDEEHVQDFVPEADYIPHALAMANLPPTAEDFYGRTADLWALLFHLEQRRVVILTARNETVNGSSLQYERGLGLTTLCERAIRFLALRSYNNGLDKSVRRFGKLCRVYLKSLSHYDDNDQATGSNDQYWWVDAIRAQLEGGRDAEGTGGASHAYRHHASMSARASAGTGAFPSMPSSSPSNASSGTSSSSSSSSSGAAFVVPRKSSAHVLPRMTPAQYMFTNGKGSLRALSDVAKPSKSDSTAPVACSVASLGGSQRGASCDSAATSSSSAASVHDVVLELGSDDIPEAGVSDATPVRRGKKNVRIDSSAPSVAASFPPPVFDPTAAGVEIDVPGFTKGKGAFGSGSASTGKGAFGFGAFATSGKRGPSEASTVVPPSGMSSDGGAFSSGAFGGFLAGRTTDECASDAAVPQQAVAGAFGVVLEAAAESQNQVPAEDPVYEENEFQRRTGPRRAADLQYLGEVMAAAVTDMIPDVLTGGTDAGTADAPVDTMHERDAAAVMDPRVAQADEEECADCESDTGSVRERRPAAAARRAEWSPSATMSRSVSSGSSDAMSDSSDMVCELGASDATISVPPRQALLLDISGCGGFPPERSPSDSRACRVLSSVPSTACPSSAHELTGDSSAMSSDGGSCTVPAPHAGFEQRSALPHSISGDTPMSTTRAMSSLELLARDINRLSKHERVLLYLDEADHLAQQAHFQDALEALLKDCQNLSVLMSSHQPIHGICASEGGAEDAASRFQAYKVVHKQIGGLSCEDAGKLFLRRLSRAIRWCDLGYAGEHGIIRLPGGGNRVGPSSGSSEDQDAVYRRVGASPRVSRLNGVPRRIIDLAMRFEPASMA